MRNDECRMMNAECRIDCFVANAPRNDVERGKNNQNKGKWMHQELE